jgi:predicted RNA-binding protein
MNYIFVINNIIHIDKVWETDDIMNYLFEKQIWVFLPSAPNLKKIKPRDNVLLYMAGEGKRCFVANFVVLSEPFKIKFQKDFPDWLNNFEIGIKIGNINCWKKVLPIKDVLDKLSFAIDKKNYGLYFRYAPRIISEGDYDTVLTNRLK